MTYRYRINPEARWSDGTEVTANDVVATYRLLMDERILFPSVQQTFGKLHEPVALSKYIVEVGVKEANWRNHLYFSASMWIFPAHEIDMPGDEYLDAYQNRYTASSGPYTGSLDDIDSGNSIVLRRNEDWWDADNPAWQGLWNFDSYKFIVVTDSNLAFEKVKKGEIDYFWVNRSSWWAEELADGMVDAVDRGLLVRTKFFTDSPIGTAGIACNMTRPPLDDRNVRLALAHLNHRELYNEKLFYGEYEPMDSYFQGPTYSNPKNEPIPYDELRAVELLEESGWTEINQNGVRVKGGKTLEFDLNYQDAASERHLTIFQENCKKAGIRINLARLTPAARWKNMTEREYDLVSTAWGGLVYPNPETSWHSRLAAKINNNNVTGFADPRVDALCEEYDLEFDDLERRREIIREIDGILFEAHPYVLDWYSPNERMVYWNKFGYPKWGGLRVHDRDEIMYCWWVDPEKEARLQVAKKDSSMVLETPPIQNHFWEAWHRSQQTN